MQEALARGRRRPTPGVPRRDIAEEGQRLLDAQAVRQREADLAAGKLPPCQDVSLAGRRAAAGRGPEYDVMVRWRDEEGLPPLTEDLPATVCFPDGTDTPSKRAEACAAAVEHNLVDFPDLCEGRVPVSFTITGTTP